MRSSRSARSPIGDRRGGRSLQEKEDWGDVFVKFSYGSPAEDTSTPTHESQLLQEPEHFFSDIAGKAIVSSEMVQTTGEPEQLFCQIVERKRPKSPLMSIIRPNGEGAGGCYCRVQAPRPEIL